MTRPGWSPSSTSRRIDNRPPPRKLLCIAKREFVYEEASMKPGVRLPTLAVFAVASVAGLLIAASDFASPFGDDSAQFTIVLWLASSAVLGFARPGRAWRWALTVGPW